MLTEDGKRNANARRQLEGDGMQTGSHTGRGWYYRKGNWTLGPVAVRELKQLVDTGALSPDQLVGNGETSEWIPAKSVVGPPHFDLPNPPAESWADSEEAATAADFEERPVAEVIPQTECFAEEELDEVAAVPAAAVPLPSRHGLPPRMLFSLLTAIPGISALVWAVLAVRLRERRLALNAVIALVWPFVGLIAGATFAVIAEIGTLTGHDIAIVYVVWAVTWAVSIAAAQWEWNWLQRCGGDASAEGTGGQTPAGGTDDPTERADRDSLALCYTLWLLLGWAGGHRFYCGRWMSGLLYAGTFGLGGAGWSADLLLLNRMIDESRLRRKSADPAHASSSGFVPALAAWAADSTRSGPIDFPLRVGFFFTAPFVFVLLCVMLNHYELLAVMVVVVVICGLLGDLEIARRRYAALYNLPMAGSALKVFDNLHGFYLEHRPRSFVFYLLYPLTAVFAASRSAAAREEVCLYGRILRPVILVIVLQQVVTYSSIYPPHLGLEEAFVRIFVLSFFGVLMTTMFLVPMVTTSFSLSLSGQHSRLKFFSIITLALALPTGIYGVYEQSTQISFLAADRLETRMEKESFRAELGESTEMFLAYHIDRVVPAASDPVSTHPELTQKYRRHIGGIALDDEVNGLVVFTLDADAGAGRGSSPSQAGLWLGVRVWYGISGDPPTVLYLMDPQRRLYTEWRSLPPAVQSRFRVVNEDEFDGNEHRPDFIASTQMIGDRR